MTKWAYILIKDVTSDNKILYILADLFMRILFIVKTELKISKFECEPTVAPFIISFAYFFMLYFSFKVIAHEI